LNQSKKDPFAPDESFKDPFANNFKDPFASEKPRDPFGDNKDNAAFKDSGLSLGLKDLSGSKPTVSINYANNVFKTGIPSPMGNYFPSGMDSGTEAARANFYFQYGRPQAYPMFSPSGAASNTRAGFGRKEMDQSPRVDIHPGIFQTPTSRGINVMNPGEMSGRRADPGSFGCSPRDISTTKAVFNQQSNFSNPKRDDNSTQMKFGGKDIMTPQGNYFSGSPYAVPGYQPAFFVPQVGNTPTGGSFGASPAGWSFNIPPSPNTGAHNGISPFNPAMAFTQVEGSSKDHLSPTFNAANDAKRKINMMTGQDSARQYNSSMNQNYYNKANPGQNFPVSPANAFSFS